MSGGYSGSEDRVLPWWEGEAEALWRERWSVPHLEIWSSLGSTNDRVRELAQAGYPPFTTVLAEEQRRGRGRSGRSWHSPSGLGLWLSTLLPPNPGAAGEPQEWGPVLPLLVGLVVAEGVERTAGVPKVGIEWPNDLVVEGRKVGGILCEGGRSPGRRWVVAGVGVNIRQRLADFPPELRQRAGSLAESGAGAVSRGELAGAILRGLQGMEPATGILSDRAREGLTRRDALLGHGVQCSTGLKGRALGIESDGSLALEVEGAVVRVRAGSVRPLLDRGGEPWPSMAASKGRE